MKKSSIPWNIKQFIKMVDKGTIQFNYAIQRPSGQWNDYQKSLFIHSCIEDYPIPPIYSVLDEGVYQIIDGKQRLTVLSSFLKDGFKLSEDTPSVFLENEEVEISGLLYSELPEDIRDEITSRSLLVYKFDEITDDEIEEMFYRLNNGTGLTKDQLLKPKMGLEMASFMDEICNHQFIKDKCAFTSSQLRKGEDITTILQAFMLITGVEIESFSKDSVMRFIENNKVLITKELQQQFIGILDWLNLAITEKNKFLKKINLPMILDVMYNRPQKLALTPDHFKQWLDIFASEYKPGGAYGKYCGAGSVKKYNVLGRIEVMKDHFENFFGINK